jgi:hypothetical protein
MENDRQLTGGRRLADNQFLFDWLLKNQLTVGGGEYDKKRTNDHSLSSDELQLAQNTSRRKAVKRLTRLQMDLLKEEHKGDWQPSNPEIVWGAHTHKGRVIDPNRMPSNALAFYRPFHITPINQWGIYLRADKLIDYASKLRKSVGSFSQIYDESMMLHLVLFEVFNHEFFHHIVESTATELEVQYGAIGKPKSVYLDYFYKKHDHPHNPLEEALANAYAYNALSFISRIKIGYRLVAIKKYQKLIAGSWHLLPPGYRSASYYMNGKYVSGGAELLMLLLQKEWRSAFEIPMPEMIKSGLLSGNSALMSKPEVPTYLVGEPATLERFNTLVPAVNEAYTQLFWPQNTDRLDAQLRELKRSEDEKKKARRIVDEGRQIQLL